MLLLSKVCLLCCGVQIVYYHQEFVCTCVCMCVLPSCTAMRVHTLVYMCGQKKTGIPTLLRDNPTYGRLLLSFFCRTSNICNQLHIGINSFTYFIILWQNPYSLVVNIHQ